MKIECVCVSTNHEDFLENVIPLNKNHFDEYHIVTKKEDYKTIDVANRHGVNLIFSELFTKNNKKFNRGAVYNEVFKKLKYNDWVVLLDSDIVLPSNFRAWFQYFNEECFFGARRIDVPTKKLFLEIIESKKVPNDSIVFRGYGYGYLQIFNAQSEVFKSLGESPYSECYDTGEGDWIFRNQWGDLIYNPPLNDNPHAEKNSNDFGSNLLRECPFQVLHLGIPGVNGNQRRVERFE